MEGRSWSWPLAALVLLLGERLLSATWLRVAEEVC